MNLKQGCSNADLKKQIREDKIAVGQKIDEMDLDLKNALAISEKRRLKVEKLEGESATHKKRAESIRVMSNKEVRDLRKKDIDLQSKYDDLEKDNFKKGEIIIELQLTISLQDETISTLKLTVNDLENAAKKTRVEISQLKGKITKWEGDYKILLKKKTGWLFFGGFAGWGINAAGEKYPTGGIGILFKFFKIDI
jgi:uncharacterized coiled-coil protein SlyX